MVIVAINKHKETIVVFGVEYTLYALIVKAITRTIDFKDNGFIAREHLAPRHQ